MLLVFFILSFLISYSNAKLIDQPAQEDYINGIVVSLPEGWHYKRMDYGLLFSNRRLFVALRGFPTADAKSILGALFRESKSMSWNGRQEHAYKKYPKGFVLYTEGIRYPVELIDLDAYLSLNPRLLEMPYRRVSYVLLAKNRALDVSIFLPYDVKSKEKEQVIELLQSITFLPPDKRLQWQYGRIDDPAFGGSAVYIPVPSGYRLTGAVIDQGNKRLFSFNLIKDGRMMRMDNLDIESYTVQTQFGANQSSMLRINGRASNQPQFLCPTNFEEFLQFMLALWQAETGTGWSILEKKEANLPELPPAMQLPLPPGASPIQVAGEFVARSERGVARYGFFRMNGVVGGSGGWVHKDAMCIINGATITIQAENQEGLKETMSMARGVYAALYINPQWRLFVLEEFLRRNKEQNQLVRQMLKESQEYNSWSSRSWANLLSDQTYVRDPSTGEVYRVYKESWRTGEFWREPVFGDLMIGGVREGSRLQELLRMEGWRKLEESLEGFK